MFASVGATDPGPSKKRATDIETAIFAGGCFWCMQPPFDRLDGVVSTTVGYVGGRRANPSYEEVAGGRTEHTEAIRVRFDPARIGYAALLDVFWRNHDPTDRHGQFVDRGKQYRPGLFYLSSRQKRLALQTRAAISKSGRFDRPIQTEVTRASAFWPAENYHQRFYAKNPARYHAYRAGSGRDAFLRRVWEARK